MKKEFELIIEKLNLNDRSIPFKLEDEYLHIDKDLDFTELELIIDEFNILVGTNNNMHVITHNWYSI